MVDMTATEKHDVIVVGAGLAGLSCAVDLADAWLDVVLLESSDDVGGRVRTDRVDDMLLDRGFQVLNPAYPAFGGFVDLDALHVGSFDAGVAVASDGRCHVLADPRRSPRDLWAGADAATGTLTEKLRFSRYAGGVALSPGASVKRRHDIAYGKALDEAGVTGRFRQAVLEPFLAGVLGEDDQSTSRVFVDLLLRTFARGTPGLPERGMQALPRQLASRLPTGVLRLETDVLSVGPGRVSTVGGDVSAPVVVVATSPGHAAEQLSLDVPLMRDLTTYYHRASSSPAARRLLHVDGDRSGPVVNTAVLSDAVPSYCRSGALIATTVLGHHTDADTRAAALAQAGRIYRCSTSDWELVAAYPIRNALVAHPPGRGVRRPVALGDGLFVCGDHRDTPSLQGAIVSGRRTAAEIVARLGGASATT